MLSCQAYDFETDGIYYKILSKGEVAVTNAPNRKEYSGDISIPSTVSYGGYTYSVTEIGPRAFEECDYLSRVTIPNTVTIIGELAFFYSKSLNYISIPNSVIEIRERAFDDCLSLSHVYIPNSVTSIGDFAFRGCDSLMSIDVDQENLFYTSLDGVLYNKELTTLLQCPGGKETLDIPRTVTIIEECAIIHCHNLRFVTIPESVKEIREEAFHDCKSLENIIIPESVIEIGEECFSNCESLLTIKLPDSISVIKQGLLYQCYALENVYLPDSIIEIEDWAFSQCFSLKSIILPSSLSFIGRYVFGSCRNLNEVTCLTKEIPELAENVFSGIASDAILYVKESVLEDYKKSEWAQYFAEILPLKDTGVENILINPDNKFSIYSTDGILIKKDFKVEDLKTLNKGIYIIVSGKEYYKISI